ncbi:hypothetical protein BBJ28_00007226 [Nothophytophthora sp. Chile5]|nr:hypothetical protein BBJ28_00007226 [Nothophytophthora sp. Chile5]
MGKEGLSSAELALRKEEYYGNLANMAAYQASPGWVSKSSIQPFPEDTSAITSSNKYNQQLIQEAFDEAKLVWDVTDEMSTRFFDRMYVEHGRVFATIALEYVMLHIDLLTYSVVVHSMEHKDDAVDMPCERCNRVDDHYSLLILCDGKDCKREYHMNCLTPPLVSIPPGDWFCPDCEKDAAKRMKAEQAEATNGQHAEAPKTDGVDSALSARGQLLSDPDSGTADDEPRSEEKCLLCGFGGELIVCEFQGCTKVYHQFCLGAYPFPKDEDATWFCPRHTCALTGKKETCEDPEKGSAKMKHASPRKTTIKNLLWKCNSCPLALTDEALPQLTQGQIFSKKSRSFMCPHCYLNAPSNVQLGKMLEKIWSTLATNRQGMPFCGPLLCGVEPLDGEPEHKNTGLDLFKVLGKIRRLDYEESAAFSRDIDAVVVNALDIIANRSFPLMEAAKTLKIIRNEQFAIHQQKIHFLDSKIRRMKADRHSGRDDDDDLVGVDKKWPLRWRQECGPFEDKYYAQLDAKSLDEWTAHVSAAPLYASADEFDDRSGAATYMSDELSGREDAPPGYLGSTRSRSDSFGSATARSVPTSSPAATRMEPKSVPGLTLSEGTDVMIALGDLSKTSGGNQKQRFGGEQANDVNGVDAREFFLSPSSSELQHMFDQQSTLLRSALEAHSTLQRSWLISQQDMLGLGGRSGFSVGEGRLAAELRLANKVRGYVTTGRGPRSFI